MLIHFDITITSLIQCHFGTLYNCVSEALRSHRKGYHVLIISRDSADWLIDNLGLSGHDIAILKWIKRNFTQASGLLSQAPIYARITEKYQLDRPANAIDITLQQACLGNFFEKTALIVEDEIADGSVYDFLLQNLCKDYGPNWVQAEWIHGGGDGITDRFEIKVQQRRIVCAIIDSDAASPKSAPSNKAEKLHKVKSDSSWTFSFVEVLPCREIENIVPFHIACSFGRTKSTSQLTDIWLAENEVGCEPTHRFWLFFDVKKGLNSRNIPNDTKANDKQWLASKLQTASITINDVEIPHLGGGIARQIFLDPKINYDEKIAALRNPEWQMVFGNFLKTLSWLCFGAKERFT